jgi:hypothetical protein
VRAPLMRITVWVRLTSPFYWTLGAAGVFPAAAPAPGQISSIDITPSRNQRLVVGFRAPYRALFAWGQPDCFFAPRLPFLDFLDFLLFLDFLAALLFFAAFFAFGCAAGAATVT